MLFFFALLLFALLLFFFLFLLDVARLYIIITSLLIGLLEDILDFIFGISLINLILEIFLLLLSKLWITIDNLLRLLPELLEVFRWSRLCLLYTSPSPRD